MAMIVDDSAQRAQQLLPSTESDDLEDSKPLESSSVEQDPILANLAGYYPQESSAVHGHQSDKAAFASHLQELLQSFSKSAKRNLAYRDYFVVLTIVLMFEHGAIKKNDKPRSMLLHTALLQEYSLSSRAVDSIDETVDQEFLQKFVETGL